ALLTEAVTQECNFTDPEVRPWWTLLSWSAFSAARKRLRYRSISRCSGSLKRNSWPTNTKACSIGEPERRSFRYSPTKSAESGVPASICTACSSVEGACTLSEVRVAGLYQYICPPSLKGRCLRCTRCYERQNACRADFVLTEFSEVRMVPVLC